MEAAREEADRVVAGVGGWVPGMVPEVAKEGSGAVGVAALVDERVLVALGAEVWEEAGVEVYEVQVGAGETGGRGAAGAGIREKERGGKGVFEAEGEVSGKEEGTDAVTGVEWVRGKEEGTGAVTGVEWVRGKEEGTGAVTGVEWVRGKEEGTGAVTGVEWVRGKEEGTGAVTGGSVGEPWAEEVAQVSGKEEVGRGAPGGGGNSGAGEGGRVG